MSGDNKVNLDPIPAPAPRPELPKVPDLPPLAALPPLPAPKPILPPAAATPSPEPAAAPPTPAPVVPAGVSVMDYLKPTRTKGVIAAGVLSLLGGMGATRYLWPGKPQPAAQLTPEASPAPLPPTTHGTTGTPAGSEFKKIDPAPAMLPATVAAAPPVEVPALTWAPSPAATAPAASALPKVELPDVVPVRATEPPAVEAPKLDVKLPDLSVTGGTTPPAPPAPPALALPVIATTPPPAATTPPPVVEAPALTAPPATLPAPATLPVPATTPAATLPAVTLPATTPPAPATTPPATLPVPTVGELPKAEVKLELPKLDPLPVATGPAAAPAKLPDMAPPPIGTPPAPKVELTPPAPPKVEVAAPPALPKVDVTPAPKVELTPPAVAPVAVDVKPVAVDVKPVAPALEPPTVGPAPTTAPPATATGAKTDYDVDLHYVKGGDSWAAVSKQYYGDERYAEALKGYNGSAALTSLQRAEVPPIHVLRKNFATAIAKPAEKAAEWGAIQPSGATEKRSGGGYKTYVVPTGGKSIKDIAADAYGDERYWGTVWESNPKLTPDKPIPEGTKIFLTSQSKIGE